MIPYRFWLLFLWDDGTRPGDVAGTSTPLSAAWQFTLPASPAAFTLPDLAAQFSIPLSPWGFTFQ